MLSGQGQGPLEANPPPPASAPPARPALPSSESVPELRARSQLCTWDSDAGCVLPVTLKSDGSEQAERLAGAPAVEWVGVIWGGPGPDLFSPIPPAKNANELEGGTALGNCDHVRPCR